MPFQQVIDALSHVGVIFALFLTLFRVDSLHIPHVVVAFPEERATEHSLRFVVDELVLGGCLHGSSELYHGIGEVLLLLFLGLGGRDGQQLLLQMSRYRLGVLGKILQEGSSGGVSRTVFKLDGILLPDRRLEVGTPHGIVWDATHQDIQLSQVALEVRVVSLPLGDLLRTYI